MAKTSKIIKTQRGNIKGFMSRRKNRCKICGRPHAYMRYFSICRLCFRELVAKGELPGVTKSSF